MEYMELVVKMPEEICKASQIIDVKHEDVIQIPLEVIASGVPLPKGHGDLIDRNDLLKHYDNTTYHNGIEERKIHFVQIGYVNDAQAIIEADKEEGERGNENEEC